MGDMADAFREMRERRKANRKKHGLPCEGCMALPYHREPSILLPGQKCRWCGTVDKREASRRRDVRG